MRIGLSVFVVCWVFLGCCMSVGAVEVPDADQVWDDRYIVTFTETAAATELGKLRRLNATTSPTAEATAITASKALMRSARAAVVVQGGDVRHELPALNAVAVRLSRAQLEGLAQRDDIQSIELDPPRFPLMTAVQTAPYGIELVQSDLVPYGGAPGIGLCVVDTGFDLGHPDLPSGVRVTGASAPGIGPWFEDEDGHGTHVAGSIMALANSQGVIGTTNGGEFGVHIYRVFDEQGSTASSSDVIAGVQSCVNAGARVVNLSLGCTGSSCYSQIEEDAFAAFYQAGILTLAAAGNDGLDPEDGTMPSYPAAYPTVVAVGAVDQSKTVAAFSQRYAQVELAAPGVQIFSTIPRDAALSTQVRVSSQLFDSEPFSESPTGTVSAALADCGVGGEVCGNVSGRICLIERGTFLFVEKAQNCEAGGGLGAIIYNNVPGPIGNGTLGQNPMVTIPVASVADTVGASLQGLLGQPAEVSVRSADYGVLSGTSMATAYASGVAALVWSRVPEFSNAQIRGLLQAGAADLGAPGRDTSYGFGLVQALDSVLAVSPDVDNDGVGNAADNCALTNNSNQLDTDTDGRGDVCDADADGDGMANDYELVNTLDPFVPDALGDQDSDGFSNMAEFYANSSSVSASSTPQPSDLPHLVAAVLPSSRSAIVGQAITAFATMINTSDETGVNCSVAPVAPLPSGFEFYATQAGTNTITGAANTTVNIAATNSQSFVLRFTPQATVSPREIRLRFGCDNLGSAAALDGLTTLLLSASDVPVADLIAIAATASNNGIVEMDTNGVGAFSVASINLGVAAQLTATVMGTNDNLPLALSICPTDLSGNCLQTAGPTAAVLVPTNATPTYSVFVQAPQFIPFDPANTRIRVTFTDETGAIRGATSVAIVRNN